MTRHGEPIRNARVKGSVDPGISHSLAFAEVEAAVAARLDLWKWEQNMYPGWFKAKIIAWYNLHNLVEVHREAAIAEKSKSK